MEKAKSKDRIIYILLIASVLGLGLYSYLNKATLMAKDLEFQAVEEPHSMILGIWDEVAKEDGVSRRLIFTDTTYTLYLQDGETSDKNTVVESGTYTLNADGTIKLQTSIPEVKEVYTSCLIETPEDKRMTIIDMGINHSFFYGVKASDQTQAVSEIKAQQENGRQSEMYISPT